MLKKKFVEQVQEIQKKNIGKIILVRNGIFFCGIGKDAVIMEQLFGYKPICIKNQICKIGVPVSKFKKLIPQLIQTGYSYIIYDYEKENQKIEEIYRIDGEKIYEEKENIGCKNCWNKANKIKTTEEYIEELKNI